ncbi:heme oxygenase (biliverdin-producing) [Corynebacterium accolens]|uniref:biliverdin-producing heme oxygenase n=1 Tax=Corynebacterium accolens TaxID=38284 RepID=UPI002542C258|nr:biliverdin-producing heme oxygenase [Corynebacterium accolens]MDK4295257.1 biliverdin-producing heme oxygenase [Corynebacterium accolens]WKS62281.1 biliverdin-producing heme oxygenase [Corynebacterium accolens]
MTVTLKKPLSVALREETAHAHENAERSAFMQRLISGELTAEAAADLGGQLWFVYESLERAVRSVANTPIASAVADPRLERRFALEADLAALVGGDWREKIRILPATASYVARLEEISGSAVEVVAHHYVRYLGDVSGGQVIAARLGALYDIEPDALNFYDFSAIGKIPPYRKGYRERLDSLILTADEREALLVEAQRAFAFNSAIFAELNKRH